MAAVVRIRPSPGQLQRIPIARETPESASVTESGEDCYLLRIHLRSTTWRRSDRFASRPDDTSIHHPGTSPRCTVERLSNLHTT
jgi:hypothetical protein